MENVTLVHHLLERGARQDFDHPFLVCQDSTTSYGEMDQRSNRLARVLVAHGLEPGGRVSLLAENGLFYVESYYSILKAGGIVVPLNTALNGDVLAQILANCGADHLLASRRFAHKALEAVVGCRRQVTLALESVQGLLDPSPGVPPLPLDEIRRGVSADSLEISRSGTDPASIIYTSGSTGEPKGATLLHRGILANTRAIVEYLRLGQNDRVLCVLPLYYVYGKSLLNTHAAAGGTVVIENRFGYPNVALDTLVKEACTGFSGVPSTFAILLNRSDLIDRDLPSLRYVTQAGGAMSPEVTRRLIAALPSTELFIMYGATEASARLSYLRPEDLNSKIGSIGKAIPGVELRVLRADGTECDAGEEGEIVASGDNIMAGYWGDPEATAMVLDELGYHTGDLAYRDEDGFIFITGRSSDFIKAGAHRISGKDIEDRVHAICKVHEVAVIGAPDEILGEKIIAFLVPQEAGADADQCRKELRRNLPSHMIPSEIVIRSELPKNESGKIMKAVLKLEYLRGG